MRDRASKGPADVEKYKELSPKAKVELLMSAIRSSVGELETFDAKLISQVTVVDAEVGKVVFELTITPEMCNGSGTLHGGCAATLMDDLTSLVTVTIARPGFLDMGAVSRTLTCTYLRAVEPGQKVKVVCEVVTAGKNLSHFRGDMITEDGKVAVSCIHDKVSRSRRVKL